jgi:hypothetical protein
MKRYMNSGNIPGNPMLSAQKEFFRHGGHG